MSGEARLTKKIKELEGKLLELAAISNNTVIEGSFSGQAVLQAATLMEICHKISEELNPKPKPEAVVKEDRDTVSEAEIKKEPEAKASNE